MASRRTGVPITDATSGFRAIGPNVLGPFASIYPAEYLGDTIESLARAGRAGYRVAEVPVAMRARGFGVSTASAISSALVPGPGRRRGMAAALPAERTASRADQPVGG